MSHYNELQTISLLGQMVIFARHCLLTGCYFEPNNVNSTIVHDAQHGVQQDFHLFDLCLYNKVIEKAGVYL